jgi:hypothetical protein
MKTTLLTIATVFAIATGANAQNGYSVYRGAAGSHPPNGFRTVAEENALMEKTLKERKQKELEESGLTAEEREKLKKEEAEAAKKRAAEERGEKATTTGAKPKTTASATKPKPKTKK